jgi:hypothetical protein
MMMKETRINDLVDAWVLGRAPIKSVAVRAVSLIMTQ